MEDNQQLNCTLSQGANINCTINSNAQNEASMIFRGQAGNGIVDIRKTSSEGLVDTYTIYYTNGETDTFTVTNGKDGSGAVNSVNGQTGEVVLDAQDVGALSDTTTASDIGGQETLVSGTNIKTINNTSLLGSGDLEIKSAPDIDGETITKNGDDELQTVAVIDNRSGSAIKTWTGTKEQYDAIVAKDSNTLYNITDDTNVTQALLNLLYPVGAIYIGTMATCPLAVLGIGTWVLKATDRVLQGAGTNTAGDTVEAGLPNITGWAGARGTAGGSTNTTGSFYWSSISNWANSSASENTGGINLNFDASLSSSIYGNSNTVQPPAYVVNIWERTA